MSAGSVVTLVVVLVLVAVVILAGALILRRRTLREGSGPEYDQLVRDIGRRRAMAEFARRRQRVAGLGIKPLSAERRSGYTGQWANVEERFIDSPPQAARAAATLVTAVAADRGYPVTDHAQLLSDLSVHHGRWLAGYRQAQRTTERADEAATEELRQAVLAHRALFTDLLGGTPDGSAGRPGRGLGATRVRIPERRTAAQETAAQETADETAAPETAAQETAQEARPAAADGYS